MPPLQAGAVARAARTLKSTQTVARTAAKRPFSTTPRRAGGGSQYDPPSGWLFGVKPGEKYQNEGWEKPFFWGFCGSLLLFACALPFKPDTS
jgi:hypothetical protein